MEQKKYYKYTDYLRATIAELTSSLDEAPDGMSFGEVLLEHERTKDKIKCLSKLLTAIELVIDACDDTRYSLFKFGSDFYDDVQMPVFNIGIKCDEKEEKMDLYTADYKSSTSKSVTSCPFDKNNVCCDTADCEKVIEAKPYENRFKSVRELFDYFDEQARKEKIERIKFLEEHRNKIYGTSYGPGVVFKDESGVSIPQTKHYSYPAQDYQMAENSAGWAYLQTMPVDKILVELITSDHRTEFNEEEKAGIARYGCKMEIKQNMVCGVENDGCTGCHMCTDGGICERTGRSVL